jgi:hypothetical protein
MRQDEGMYIGPSESESLPETRRGAPTGPADPGTAEQLIEALASGQCPPDQFVDRVLGHPAAEAELVWDVLALLDQNYRRRRIDRETYNALKARLQRHSLGVREEGPSRAIPRQRPMEPRGGDGPPRTLVEASLHREVRAGDLLCGRYRVVDILRRREWVTTVEAVDESKAALPGVRQRVMLQVLDEHLSREPLLLQRVGQLQELSHPAIARLLDAVEHEDALVLVCEFAGGAPLDELLERRSDRRLPVQAALAIVRSVAGALAWAHARGIAHGDLGEASILVTELGDTRLTGFELRPQSHAVHPAADRLAFARLACKLLTGNAEPGPAASALPLAGLRVPAGVTRAQWQALRATLDEGVNGTDTGVLAAFGGTSLLAGPLLLQEAGEQVPPPARNHLREWVACGVVLAVLGVGAYLYKRELPAPEPAAAPPAPGAATTGEATAAGAVPVGFPAADPAAQADAVAPAGSEDDVTAVAEAATGTVPPPPPPQRPVIELAATYAWVETTDPVARIRVMRRGSLDRDVTFRWWTETGTAQADREFRAIEPRLAAIPAGSRSIELLVPLIPDPDRREPRTFYVKIDEPNPGVGLGEDTLMQVAIVPPGYPAARGPGGDEDDLLP